MRALVPPKQLLVFEVKEGWAPLCKFLQLPVPDIPFPNINDAGEIRFYHVNFIQPVLVNNVQVCMPFGQVALMGKHADGGFPPGLCPAPPAAQLLDHFD